MCGAWLSTGFLSWADLVSCLPHPKCFPCWLNFHTFQRVQQDGNRMTSDLPVATLKTRKSRGQRTPFKKIIPNQNSTCGQITKKVCGKHEDALKFTLKNTTQMSCIQKLLELTTQSEAKKYTDWEGRKSNMVGGEGQLGKQLVPWRLTMVRPGASGEPDCAESRVQTVRGTEESQDGGNQQKKSSEDRWRANCALSCETLTHSTN